MTVNARTITDNEYFYGHKACAGCAGSLVVRQALKVLGPRTICALPAGCMSAVGFNFPQLCFANNAFITPFAATASVLTGIRAGLEAQGEDPDTFNVVGFAGDGGTADIGIQALSGAIDRNEDIIYICYDNEAYMNTGIQKSGLTPFGARTTTTPVGKNDHGCLTQKKNLFEIVCRSRPALRRHRKRRLPQRLHRQGREGEQDPWHEASSTSSPLVPPAGATPPTRRSRSPRRLWTAACGIWPSTRVLR